MSAKPVYCMITAAGFGQSRSPKRAVPSEPRMAAVRAPAEDAFAYAEEIGAASDRFFVVVSHAERQNFHADISHNAIIHILTLDVNKVLGYFCKKTRLQDSVLHPDSIHNAEKLQECSFRFGRIQEPRFRRIWSKRLWKNGHYKRFGVFADTCPRRLAKSNCLALYLKRPTNL